MFSGLLMTQLLFLSFPALIVFAGSYDIFSKTISNRLCLAIVLAFLPAAVSVGMGTVEIASHASCALVMLCAGFALFSAGWIGGGDAKLFAATTLWLGPAAMLAYSLNAALLGGALTLLLLFMRSVTLPAALLSQGWLVRLHSPNEGVPYGIALAAAGLMIYPETPFMAALGG